MVEGSQQIAMARYVLKSVAKGSADLHKICHQNLDGARLQDAIAKLVNHYSLKSMIETYKIYENVSRHIENVGNSTDICSPQNTTS